jgi:glycosyltransferase involved in cell wall biosynthesis
MTMDIICFSHLRWNFVFQRPQHILSRLARSYRIFYIEEPVYGAGENRNKVTMSPENVWIVTPHITHEHGSTEALKAQREGLDTLWSDFMIRNFILWYYTPMALPYTRHMQPQVTVYDCMDELSAFKFAPPTLTQLEDELFEKADVVFTGGHSLYSAKRHRHQNIHPFPSSIEKSHFAKARTLTEEPADQAVIPQPRIGFFGVLDERFDIDLVEKVAVARPDWQIVLIGPVVKIDEASLPRRDNIHYLGQKSYTELPAYISGWDLAMIPFALNESTRFISPTKTPEYLAAGKPVISTAIRDVVSPYGEEALVHIIHSAEGFIEKATMELNKKDRSEWLGSVDAFLEGNSWERTCGSMKELIQQKTATFSNQKKSEVNYV